jgi:hypothetical protein
MFDKLKKVIVSGKEVTISASDTEVFNSRKWHLNSNGYVVWRGVFDGKKRTIRLHRELMGVTEGQFVDHIDGNKLDNSRGNLRVCTYSQNRCNVGMRSNNTTGYKGVTLIRSTGKFRAQIGANGRCKNLGHFDTAEEAARVYDSVAAKQQGEFARLNYA